MSLDVIHRYRPIIDLLRPELGGNKSHSILEVGSGGGGLAQYADDLKIVNCDVCFGNNRIPGVQYVAGNSSKLPFKNKRFNWLVSVDMFEHIEQEKRADVLCEFIRLSSSGFILAFPSGEKSRKYEKVFAGIYQFFGVQHVWLQEHFKYPVLHPADIVEAIRRMSPASSIKVLKNANVVLWFISMILSMPLLVISKVFKVNLKTYMRLFGWTAAYINFGTCYRTIIMYQVPPQERTQTIENVYVE